MNLFQFASSLSNLIHILKTKYEDRKMLVYARRNVNYVITEKKKFKRIWAMKNFYIWRKMLNISHARVSKKKRLFVLNPIEFRFGQNPSAR